MLKRLYFSVLIHIMTSKNGPILTEICEPPPPGTCNKNLEMFENAVKRPAFGCPCIFAKLLYLR